MASADAKRKTPASKTVRKDERAKASKMEKKLEEKRAKSFEEARAKNYAKVKAVEGNVAKKFSEVPLGKLMSQLRFQSLTKLCFALKPYAPLPHVELLSTLLRVPHFVKMRDLETALNALVTAAVWNCHDSEEYFRHLLWPIMDTFCEESKEAVKRCLLDRPLMNESFSDLIFTKGDKRGQLKLNTELAWNPEGRAFDDCDSVWLTLMDGEKGVFCECWLAQVNPLVLCGDEENPIIQAALEGQPCRIDKLAARTTFVRTLCALHCMTEPERPGGKKEKKELPERLPAKFAPSPSLKKILRPFGPSHVDRMCWAKEEPRLPQKDGEKLRPSRELNESQLQAVNSAEKTLTLIQGPPGTGKTTTCVQILRRWALSFKPPNKSTRILGTSGSNIAVDNLVEGLLQQNVKVVRIGRPESTRPELAASAVENVAARALGVKSLADISYQHRRQALHNAIKEAQVVCCTAITAGSGLLKDFSFPLVLVDEASQATEPALLVPICHGARQLVLCGDHCQLPPTVKSESQTSEVLKMSLFERLALTGVLPIMLNVQYRMHPLLSAFPSTCFYDQKLEDAEMVHSVEMPEAWPFERSLAVVPVFEEEAPKGTSHMNQGEANVLVSHVCEYLERGGTESSLGVISPYDSQVKLLRRMLQQRGVRTGLHGVEVNSVDGFQGREKEVMMISTVRSNLQNATGFVRDWRRINVALTRAKSGLLVVCNPCTLARDTHSWLPWLQWSRSRGVWANDTEVQLPRPRRYSGPAQVGVRALRTPPRRAPSRSRSPPPNWL